jgi:ABC-type glycerol-3-phosphate transport system substrate-binding protein
MPRKICLVILIFLLSFFGAGLHSGVVSVSGLKSDLPDYVADGSYQAYLEAGINAGYADNKDFIQTVSPVDFTGTVLSDETEGYHGPAAAWDDSDQMEFNVHVETSGLYRFYLDFFPLDADYSDYEMAVYINGVLPFSEAEQIILYKYWNAGTGFSVDRYGNDFYASQTIVTAWTNQALVDPLGLYVEPLAFHLNAGDNIIRMNRKKGSFLLGDITLTGLREIPSYSTYASGATLSSDNVLLTTEAETPMAKNSSSIQAGVNREIGVTPFEVSILKLNILAGSTCDSERETVQYAVEVPKAGYYHLTFKVQQSENNNAAVFRTLRINDEIPFQEAASLLISYTARWQNYTPSDENGNPYLFYFAAGTNKVSLSVDLSLYRETYLSLQQILRDVNQLSLDIKKLTGNQVDKNRDWSITDFMPNIVTDLQAMAAALEAERDYIDSINGSDKASEVESNLKICIRNLRILADKPDEIPQNIKMLSTSTTSVASMLGGVLALLLYSPLDIDKFYVHTAVELPAPNGNFFARVWLSIRRFVLSFFEERYSEDVQEDELEIWVNRSKQYVDLIQKLADENFTTATGVPVKVSVMSSEGKLILANSAGQNPDVALGIASWMPYDLGIRGALYDLSAFSLDPSFSETLALFNPESLIPMVYDEGLYGLPDTENFYVLYYRTDIMSTLDLEVPQTWEDVTEIMPILRRFGMNFYIPLSSATSLKAFDSTLPFLFQYGSTVYDADAFGTALDDNASVAALTMMTELYTIYSMEVTVSSFYNDFRLGTCPIGVGDFGMYVTLQNAAPDIQGLWGIALLPGVEKSGGTIDRSAPGAATANVIFGNTEKAEESWSFLQWWASTETQVEFETLLLSTLGKSYLWNSANTDAFSAVGLPIADLDIILEQWSWLKELPKVPGSYQVELEISNLWNSVVINRENLLVKLNEATIRADKEIRKKMSEFDYMDQYGNVKNAYVLASRSLIDAWIGGAGE